MKRIVGGISLVLAVLSSASFSGGQAPAAGSPEQLAGNGAPPLSNPLKVALLKWYAANETGITFPVGMGPTGVAFDGANIWTANYNDGTVTKLRASDGTVLGTFKGFSAPGGVTFDGANIWVSNSITNNVSKVRASDGTILGTFPVPGVVPWWMTFDGANVWVPSENANGNGWVTKLRASDGKNLGNFAVGNSPIASAFDGASVWVTNLGGVAQER